MNVLILDKYLSYLPALLEKKKKKKSTTCFPIPKPWLSVFPDKGAFRLC